MDSLISWPHSENDAIRYFSGTATYRNHVFLPKDYFKENISLVLSLGNVKIIAEIIVNGHKLGTLWKSPFTIDLGKTVHEGINELEIKVTNLWPNRLIGDEQYIDDLPRKNHQPTAWPDWLTKGTQRTSGRTTIAIWDHWHKTSKLLPSGLLGPVIVRPYVNKILR